MTFSLIILINRKSNYFTSLLFFILAYFELNNITEKKDIKDLLLSELQDILQSSGYAKFRAIQIFTHLYKNRLKTFSDFYLLPADLRDFLEQNFKINSLTTENIQYSIDGTTKFLFALSDDSAIESVLIPTETIDEDPKLKRLTLCVSSQVGCALDCSFCATGKLGYKRNLKPSEIVEQVLQVESHTGKKISNIVFMGMGEPLHNIDNVVKAIDILSNSVANVISRKKITISTAGIVPKILELANIPKPVKLAISLHSTTNGVRQKIMPIAKKWNIQSLRDSITQYYRKTNIPITYEYILFDGLNNSQEDAKRLAKFARTVPSKVNIIPFHDISFTNPTGFARELKPAGKEQIEEFVSQLKNLGVNVYVRTSSGVDIDAACGQLAYSKR